MPAPYDPVPILNASGEDIPSHAVVEPTGAVTDGAFEVRKPTRDGYRGVLVNGPGVVPAGKAGQAYAHPRVVVQAAGSPAVGEEWGARAGSWQLGDVGGGGFIVLTPVAGGRVNALRYGVSEAAEGSGSGASAGGAGGGTGGGGTRCSGTVFSRTSSRVARVGDQLVQYTRLETLAYNAAGCLELTVGQESSAVLADVGCCEDGGSQGGSGASGSAPTGPNIPCNECFGPGTPHPSYVEPDVPAALTVTWTDLGASKAFDHDGSEPDYQADATGMADPAFAGLINMTISLCTGVPGTTGYILTMNFTDPADDAAIELTLVSCDPIVLSGSGPQGAVVITE